MRCSLPHPAEGSLTGANVYIASDEGIQNAINALSWEDSREGAIASSTITPRGEDALGRSNSQSHHNPGGQGQDFSSRGQGQDRSYAHRFGREDQSYGYASRTRQSRVAGRMKGGDGGVDSEDDLSAKEKVALREGRPLRSSSMDLDGSEPFGEEPQHQVPRPTKQQGAKLSVSSDSGIGLPQPSKWPNQLHEFPSADVTDMVGGEEPQELSATILSKGFGPLYMYEGSHDYPHDSDSDHSGQVHCVCVCVCVCAYVCVCV